MNVRIIKKYNSVENEHKDKKSAHTLSNKQNTLIGLIGAKRGISKAKMLRMAGYSEKIARNPKRVFNTPAVAQAMDQVIEKLRIHRDNVLNRMEETYQSASYSSLASALSTLNKGIQLLSNIPAPMQRYELSDERKKQLEELLKMNS